MVIGLLFSRSEKIIFSVPESRGAACPGSITWSYFPATGATPSANFPLPGGIGAAGRSPLAHQGRADSAPGAASLAGDVCAMPGQVQAERERTKTRKHRL